MTVAEARAEIEMFTVAAKFPTLDAADIDALMKKAKRASPPFTAGVLTGTPLNNNIMPRLKQGTVPPDTFVEWEAATLYAVGDQVVPAVRNGHFYTVTVGGTSAATEPDFPTDDEATVVDGTVTWQEAGVALWVPTWGLAYAIAQGWKLKAAKVTAAYDYQSDDQRLARSQIFKACMEQYKAWSKQVNESIEQQGSLRDRRSGSIPSANDERLWCDCDDGVLGGPSRGLAIGGPSRVTWDDEF